MWTVDTNALEQWAAVRDTDIKVAEAIAYFAEDDDDMDRMWQDPTDEETRDIWARATNNGELDDAELRWGVWNLKTIADALSRDLSIAVRPNGSTMPGETL